MGVIAMCTPPRGPPKRASSCISCLAGLAVVVEVRLRAAEEVKHGVDRACRRVDLGVADAADLVVDDVVLVAVVHDPDLVAVRRAVAGDVRGRLLLIVLLTTEFLVLVEGGFEPLASVL